MTGARLIWQGAGCPVPTETDGAPIRKSKDRGHHCAACGEPAEYDMKSAISDNFTTVHNASRAWSFGGTHLCAACVWACKTPALRCAMFFARENGLWFLGTWALKGLPQTRPDSLSALLNPPEPPFVACYPLAGVDHGGEDALERTMLQAPELSAAITSVRSAMEAAFEVLLKAKPKDVDAATAKKIVMRSLVNLHEPWPSKVDFAQLRADFGRYRWESWWRWAAWSLIRIQSKHTAIYARVSTSRDRYHLQVDDALDIMVDVALWREMRTVAEALLADMRAAGVGSREASASLVSLRPPMGMPLPLIASWASRVAPMRAHHAAKWWPVFVSLLPMPALTITPKEGS